MNRAFLPRHIDPQLRSSLLGFVAVVIFVFLLVAISFGQPLDANHAELAWMTFETEHFIIHYHDGARRTATVIAKIAEEIHPTITSMYGYEPDTKFHFIVKDTDDYANGAAYYYNNKMLIWATALDYDLRGTKDWLRDVITHEYTHIIQLGAARKLPRNIPAIYLQVLGYEEEKRPDVLYGFPNILSSYPIAMTVMPNWLAEGTAQFNSPKLRYDWLDSHRDMQLRLRALADSLLPLSEMEVFGKNSLGNESVYNHGFSLVSFISKTWGPEKLAEITRNQSKLFRADINTSIREALGISGLQLHQQWTSSLKQHYREWTTTIRQSEVSGRKLSTGGYANLYSRFSPDGQYLYFTSNRGNDYLSQRSLYRIPATGKGELEEVAKEADGPFAFTPDGKGLIYSKIVRQGNESYFADLYALDLESEKEVRLTRFARATEPDVNGAGDEVVFVVNRDGTKDLASVSLPPRGEWQTFKTLPVDSLHKLTDFNDGSRAYRPLWSEDGETILFAKSTYVGRDIFMMDFSSGAMTPLIVQKGDQRDPVWVPAHNAILYSSDESGIHNIYRRVLSDSVSIPLTNVLGGAFMPALSPTDSSLAYSEWTLDGYRISLLDSPGEIADSLLRYGRDYLAILPEPGFNDSDVDTFAAHPYRPIFEQLFFVPRLTLDYGTFKPGVYIYSSDFLEKLNMFTGFNFNRAGEYDIMGALDFKALRPTLFAELYWIKRLDEASFDDTFRIVGETTDDAGNSVPIYDTQDVDYRFHLMEMDLGARVRLATPLQLELRSAISRYDAFLEYPDLTVFHYTYFKGLYLQGRLDYDSMPAQIRGNIHPRNGTRAQLTVAREQNRFIEGFEVNASALTLQEVYGDYEYWRIEADITRWFTIAGDLVAQPRLRAGYLDHQVDPFLHLYVGGLYGMRGYSFYSLGGTRTAIGSLALRHPLWQPNRPRLGWLHLDGVYLGLFADIGDAWRERKFEADQLKRDIGAELRLKFFSWYGYPTAVTFAAARSLDEVTVTENDATTRYETGWRYYLTVLFDFETIFPSRGKAWRMQ